MARSNEGSSILKDVVAYVDVWSSSKTENISKPFIDELKEMGAEVSKTFKKHVTHVVFKDGHQSTWNKARKIGAKLVSVLWVDRCKEEAKLVDEELFPGQNDEANRLIKKRTHRCMQPKDSAEKTPENNIRMKKKLDKMIKDLAPQYPLFPDVSPYIIDQENGIVYSPSLKRSDSMARRLKEMREKRDSPSPPASQEVEAASSSPAVKPCFGFSPTILKLLGGGSQQTVAAGRAGNTSADEASRMKMEQSKATRTLVTTSMSTDTQKTVTEVVKLLGGFSVVDLVCETTTHVVSGGQRRTLNVLLGIARGCWVLSFEWMLRSLEQRRWLPEEPYELSESFPAAPICRLQQHLSAGEHQQDLFHLQPAIFVSQQSQPPPDSLVELIQLCGGTVCKTVRQAGLCVGPYSGRRPEGCRNLSEQWVLDCITQLKPLSYENYNLE
ncbi:microcephalin isoform X2 [Gadus chalcogrammus]|uniref:microcephalin isoform X2 n=1 Tax=Gadus chalcogrammus TaxID=1042646 RepID=UPI0024C4CD82|nr:microcephalin isoform X2 [Gadus chalcogrammus]